MITRINGAEALSCFLSYCSDGIDMLESIKTRTADVSEGDEVTAEFADLPGWIYIMP